MNTIQRQYLADWHDSFVNYIEQMSSFIETMMLMPQATEKDKQVMHLFKAMLHRNDVLDIQNDLYQGVIRKSTLDKIANFNKDFFDQALEQVSLSPILKEILKQMSHLQIEWDKQSELLRLESLKIPLVD